MVPNSSFKVWNTHKGELGASALETHRESIAEFKWTNYLDPQRKLIPLSWTIRVDFFPSGQLFKSLARSMRGRRKETQVTMVSPSLTGAIDKTGGTDNWRPQFSGNLYSMRHRSGSDTKIVARGTSGTPYLNFILCVWIVSVCPFRPE